MPFGLSDASVDESHEDYKTRLWHVIYLFLYINTENVVLGLGLTIV